MTQTQQNTIARQRARAGRLVEIARTSKKKRDQLNAGWSLNVLHRMEEQAD